VYPPFSLVTLVSFLKPHVPCPTTYRQLIMHSTDMRGSAADLMAPLEVVAQFVGAVEGHAAVIDSANEPGRAMLLHVAAAVTSATKGLAAALKGTGDAMAECRCRHSDGSWWRCGDGLLGLNSVINVELRLNPFLEVEMMLGLRIRKPWLGSVRIELESIGTPE
jgi:hypothetical protein